MVIGDRLRELREYKKLSQGDIEKRTGLLRCYISRVENGHTVPAIETLEKFARAMEVPIYQFFYDGNDNRKGLLPTKQVDKDGDLYEGKSGKERRELDRFVKFLSRIDDTDRKMLLSVAGKMASAKKKRKSKQ
jgi:transcriptional regulator with XRE-family HTH domain